MSWTQLNFEFSGGECDRLSAFEALTNQLQNLQQDYMSDKGYG